MAPFTFAARGLGDFEPGGGPPAQAKWVRDQDRNWQLYLAKNVPLSEVASGGAQINGVAGMSTTGLTLGFDVEGYCGAGAPRFNVRLSSGALVFLGCVYGNDGSGHVSFAAGNSYGGVLLPEGETVESISIVLDEPGISYLDNIFVNEHVAPGPGNSN